MTQAVEKVVIERPDQLTVAERRNVSATYPPEVFRSCDAGVQLLVLVRERKPMWPVGRKVGGAVVLRAVVTQRAAFGTSASFDLLNPAWTRRFRMRFANGGSGRVYGMAHLFQSSSPLA